MHVYGRVWLLVSVYVSLGIGGGAVVMIKYQVVGQLHPRETSSPLKKHPGNESPGSLRGGSQNYYTDICKSYVI